MIYGDRSNQLWRFVKYGDYYQIIPMVSNEVVMFKDNFALRTESADSSYSNFTPISKLWKILKVGNNSYCIVPKSDPTQFIQMIDTYAYVMGGNASLNTSKWEINEFEYNRYWQGTYIGLPTQGKIELNYTIDLAVFNVISETLCTNGAEVWNEVFKNEDTGVELNYVAHNETSGKTIHINICAGDFFADDDSLGSTCPKIGNTQYGIYNTPEEAFYSDWSSVTIYLNLAEIIVKYDSLYQYYCCAGDGSKANGFLKFIITHETGHALKLAHPINADEAEVIDDSMDDNSDYLPPLATYPCVMQPSGYGNGTEYFDNGHVV